MYGTVLLFLGYLKYLNHIYLHYKTMQNKLHYQIILDKRNK